VIDPLSVIITHLSEVVKKHAHELLGRREVNRIREQVKKTDHYLVEDVIPAVIPIASLQKNPRGQPSDGADSHPDVNTILETHRGIRPPPSGHRYFNRVMCASLKRTITRKSRRRQRHLRSSHINADVRNNDH
jgi:flagellar biosynthesis protein FlhA